jgi:large subunit ribosomal protein L36
MSWGLSPGVDGSPSTLAGDRCCSGAAQVPFRSADYPDLLAWRNRRRPDRHGTGTGNPFPVSESWRRRTRNAATAGRVTCHVPAIRSGAERGLIMKVRNSLRSLKSKPGSVVTRRRGRMVVINRKNPRWNGRQG